MNCTIMTSPAVWEVLIQTVPHFLPIMGRCAILLENQSSIGVITANFWWQKIYEHIEINPVMVSSQK
jgi:hypothetical protein